MVLLCYDHHENVKQIEINSDSGSESDDNRECEEDDSETESFRADPHKETVQKGQATASGDVLKWTQKLSNLQILVSGDKSRWYIVLFAVIFVGIGVISAWFYL